MLLKKSLDMFKFTKSETDLGKLAEPIQYKVLCDWLRNIHSQNIQLARKITVLQASIASLLENDSQAEDMAKDYGDSSNSGSVR